NGNAVDTSKIVSTGATVDVISDFDGSILETYTLILFGDLIGDGIINALDFVFMKRHIWKIDLLEGPALLAASINAKDKSTAVAPSNLDFVLMKRHVWKIALIVQPVAA
ncbi:MAG: hypothetical protein J6X47_05845, partial [Clostridia bacterium]|nr:hypothetical protein [Clostridia bacterium]